MLLSMKHEPDQSYTKDLTLSEPAAVPEHHREQPDLSRDTGLVSGKGLRNGGVPSG